MHRRRGVICVPHEKHRLPRLHIPIHSLHLLSLERPPRADHAKLRRHPSKLRARLHKIVHLVHHALNIVRARDGVPTRDAPPRLVASLLVKRSEVLHHVGEVLAGDEVVEEGGQFRRALGGLEGDVVEGLDGGIGKDAGAGGDGGAVAVCGAGEGVGEVGGGRVEGGEGALVAGFDAVFEVGLPGSVDAK